MGCNCGKGNTATQVKYQYTDPTGKVTKNLSDTQARAMQIRKGGGSYSVQTQ